MRVVLTRGHELLREVRLEKPVAIVGRDPACDIAIEDITISKRHLKLEYADGALYVEDLGSTNGLKVNGHLVKRQALHHLDVIQVGNHKIHVFDDSLLPAAPLDPESTVQTTSGTRPSVAPPPAEAPLADTQPTAASRTTAPLLGLARVDAPAELVRLDQPNTMIGESGQSALLTWRRDALYLSRLSRDGLRVNGRELGAGSCAIRSGDVIEVGAARYRVVTVDR